MGQRNLGRISPLKRDHRAVERLLLGLTLLVEDADSPPGDVSDSVDGAWARSSSDTSSTRSAASTSRSNRASAGATRFTSWPKITG